MFTIRTCFVIAVVGCSLGCSKRIDECNALVKQINDTSIVVQQNTQGLDGNPKQAEETLTKFASTTKTETGKIAAVELSVEELSGFSKNYQAMLAEIGTAATTMGEAAGELQSIQEQVSKDRHSWMSASSKIKVACIKAGKECQKLEVLTKPPMVTGTAPGEDAKALDEYAKAIAEVELENEDVKAAVGEIKKSLKAFAETLRRADAAAKEVEKATADLKAAAEKEPALIEGINSFCQGNE